MPEWVGYFLSGAVTLILALAAYIASTVRGLEKEQATQTKDTALLRRDVDALTSRVNSLHDWRNFQQQQDLSRLQAELQKYKEKHGEL